MQIDFSRVIKETLAFTIGACALVLFLQGRDSAFALFLGSLWGCANFYVIQKLIICCFTNEWNLLSIATAVLVKFPFLYGTGFLILKGGFPPLYLLIGMSLIFLTLLLKITKRAYERVHQ